MSSRKRQRRDNSCHTPPGLPKVAVAMAGDKNRLIYGCDIGTTYSTMGLARLENERTSVKNLDIQYVDSYPDEIINFNKSADCVPTTIYFGEDIGDAVQCGWSVTEALQECYPPSPIHHNLNHYIQGFKLLLDTTAATKKVRENLKRKVHALVEGGFTTCREGDDIFVCFFTWWLRHSRECAIARGLEEGVPRPEFVLTMPSGWGVPSYQRWLKAFDQAIRNVWHIHNDSNPPKIFTISEPSAAASFYLAEGHHLVEDGDCVMVVDAGGGTMEILLYRKTAQGWDQCSSSSAETCGGNSLNEAIRNLATRKLHRYASYLVEIPGTETIESIVECRIVGPFEARYKRSIRALNFKNILPFQIDRLRSDPQHGFRENKMELSEDEWGEVFRGPFTGLEKLIKEQYKRIRKLGYTVHHVCWVGQFSDSNILRQKGREIFDSYEWPNQVKPTHVHEKNISTIAVAGGGIRGYLGKNGPGQRVLSASFAVLRHYPRPMLGEVSSKSLWNAKYKRGDDGLYYAFNRLDWFATAGTEFKCEDPFIYESTHLFPVKGDGPWEARETLYYSSRMMEKSNEHYLFNHPKNQGSQELGTVTFNMGRLQDFKEYLPQVNNGDPKNPAKNYVVQLLVSVNALDGFFHELRLSATWNPDDETGIFYNDEIRGADINIAAAFQLTNV